MPNGYGLTMRTKLMRAFTTVLTVILTLMMTTKWISVGLEVNQDVWDDMTTGIHSLMEDLLDELIQGTDIGIPLTAIRNSERFNGHISAALEILSDNVAYYPQALEVVDTLVDELIEVLAQDMNLLLENTSYELLDRLMYNTRSLVERLPAISLELGYSVLDLSGFTGAYFDFEETALAVFPDSDLLSSLGQYAEIARMAENTIRAVWFLSIALLLTFLFIISCGFKSHKLMGIISVGFVMVLSLVSAFVLDVSGLLLAETIIVQISSTIWVYATLGLSIMTLIVILIGRA